MNHGAQLTLSGCVGNEEENGCYCIITQYAILEIMNTSICEHLHSQR